MNNLNTKIMKNHISFEKAIDDIIEYGLGIISNKEYLEKEKNIKRGTILEALLLRSCALWEGFIEQEIVFWVMKDPSILIREVGLSKNAHLNEELIRAILFSDRYRDFHDIERTKGNSKKIISQNNNVFFRITSDQSSKINFVYKLRNYLSHYSSYSKRKLMDEYKTRFSYRIFLSPSVFLQKKDGKNFEDLVHNFKLASMAMKRGLK